MVTSTLTDVMAPLLNISVTVKNGAQAIKILRGRKREKGAMVAICLLFYLYKIQKCHFQTRENKKFN